MERKNIYSTLQFSVRTFTLGAFLLMTFVAVGLPILFSKGNFEVVRQLNWWVYFLELFVMTAGFFLMTINLSNRILLKQSRGFLAGIVAVILMAIMSIFSQGASLLMIMIFSLIAGMTSTLSLLLWNKRSML